MKHTPAPALDVSLVVAPCGRESLMRLVAMAGEKAAWSKCQPDDAHSLMRPVSTTQKDLRNTCAGQSVSPTLLSQTSFDPCRLSTPG